MTVTQEWATLEDLRLGLQRGAQSVRAQWRVVGVTAVATAAAFAALSFALPTLYESRAIVATVNSSQGLASSGAAALAARLGLANLAPGGGNISLPFLVAVAESWHVVDRTGSDLRRWLVDSGVAARVDTAKLLGCRLDREPGPVTLCIRRSSDWNRSSLWAIIPRSAVSRDRTESTRSWRSVSVALGLHTSVAMSRISEIVRSWISRSPSSSRSAISIR